MKNGINVGTNRGYAMHSSLTRLASDLTNVRKIHHHKLIFIVKSKHDPASVTKRIIKNYTASLAGH